MDVLFPLIAAAASLIVAILSISPWPVGVFEDDAMYVILGKSLATGQGYRFLNLPGHPNATHYPPGFPAFLAVLWKLFPSFPDNIVVFKFANAFLLAACAWGTYVFARRRLALRPLAALLVTLCATATVPVLLVTGVVMSEPMFLALLLPVLLICERAADRGTLGAAAAAGLACGLLGLVRTFGVVAVPALALVLLLRRRPLAALVAVVVAAAALAPWQLWASGHDAELPPVLIGKYGSYTTWLARGYIEGGWPLARGVMAKNLAEAAGMLTFTVMPTPPAWPRMATAALLVLLLPAGGWWLWRRSPVVALFTAGYTAVLLIWPFEPHRFIIAVAPLVAFLLAGTAVPAVEGWRRGGRAQRALSGAVLAVHLAFLIGFACYNWTGVRRGWWERMQQEASTRSKPVVEWIARHTAPTDVVAVDHELLVHLYTGRPAVPYLPFVPKARLASISEAEQLAAMTEILRAYRVRYLATGYDAGVKNATKLVQATPPALRLVGSVRSALFYQTLR